MAELNKHIIEIHKCPKENCIFSSPDNKVLLAHILNHRTVNSKDLACKFCDDIFVDITSLENHIQAVHTLKCNVCLQTDFASISSLEKHKETCIAAPLTVTEAEKNNPSQPLFQLLDYLGKNAPATDIKELQRIKSLTIKSQQMAATPELYLKKISPLCATPTFDPKNEANP